MLFHGFIAVAPLKRILHLSRQVLHAALPRLHRRGPIEARRCVTSCESSPSLPRLHRRGPIEARSSGSIIGSRAALFHGFIAVAPLKRFGAAPACLWRHALPRLHRRGPIEATMSRSCHTTSVLFHGFIAVAPLKPAVHPHDLETVAALPRLHRRAEIRCHFIILTRKDEPTPDYVRFVSCRRSVVPQGR